PWDTAVPGSPVAQAGIPAARIAMVRSGRLEELTYSRFWAQTKGRAPTPGPVNQIVTSNQRTVSVEEMIRTAQRALLVSRFWYIRRVDPRTASVTGLTRDGVWLVENGKIQYPVRNFRFNQSLIQMLAPGNVDEIGLPERVGDSEEQGSDSRLVPALR